MRGSRGQRLTIPRDQNSVRIEVEGRQVQLTNLHKVFWPDLGLTKGDLIQFYADVAPLLLPHIRNRAMVMKRYPNGITGDFFFMKRAPEPRPAWIEICRGRVLVDYNQNAWGRTLASIYSVRPRPLATVSTPVTWKEIDAGIRIEDFRVDNVRDRIAKRGDLWAPLLQKHGRVDLRRCLGAS